MASKDTYIYFRVPKESPAIGSYAEKYRQLRLSALELSPSSFSSTYEAEAAFPVSLWISRLTRPSIETFICAATSPSASSDALQGEWVAQVSLLGPFSTAAFALPPAALEPPMGADVVEEKWQMLALYTLPTHRGAGIAKKLCLRAFEYLISERESQAQRVRVRIVVKPENTPVLEMYKKLGFVDAGLATLAEALRANGDAEMVPKDGGGEKFNTRGGRVMVKVMERKI